MFERISQNHRTKAEEEHIFLLRQKIDEWVIKVNEAKASLEEAESGLKYYQDILSLLDLKPETVPETSSNSAPIPQESLINLAEESRKPQTSRIRTVPKWPIKEKIKHEFDGMRLNKIIEKILFESLASSPGGLDVDDLTRLIYDTSTDEEYKRCRNATRSLLRNMEDAYAWRRTENGKYIWDETPKTQSGETVT
jgi:hypothetical protein